MVRMNGMNGMNGMGPRGPMYGHRGRGGNGGSGMGLLLLPALLFGGWVVFPVLAALVGVSVALFAGMAALVTGLLEATAGIAGTVLSHSGIVIGFIIGLAAVRYIWKRRNG